MLSRAEESVDSLDCQVEAEQIFKLFANGDPEGIQKSDILAVLSDAGIRESDPRLESMMRGLEVYSHREKIGPEEFFELIKHHHVLLQHVLQGGMVIPDFSSFTSDIRRIYQEVRGIERGKVATYIPQLANTPPHLFGISICTVDGQMASMGDARTPFCIQSTCKPINYCIALEEHGESKVHSHVGREPSGRGFNELTLNNDNLPHNPMINAGAIMGCSLIQQGKSSADRFDHVLNTWAKMSGGRKPGFNNGVYQSEKNTADRNFALGYFIREKNGFPENTDLLETLDFYFQCCSIELDCEQMATTAATLANGGVCPFTGDSVVSKETAKSCLSLLHSCGMYDFSGEFSYIVGLPAKSGVSGAIMVVIPNTMGICIWSPPLDQLGNSVRGVEFCKRLVSQFPFHPYDCVTGGGAKVDPRLRRSAQYTDQVVATCYAASQGDLHELKQMHARGTDLSRGDYDGRTPLHLAVSEGQLNVVHYLIAQGVPLDPKDRWGNTPMDDAEREEYTEIALALKSALNT